MIVRVTLQDGREGDLDTASIDFQDVAAFYGETIRIKNDDGEEIEGVLANG